MLKEQ
jgi:cold shock protein